MKYKIKNKPIILCIMDGWGLRNNKDNNAIKLANTPNYDFLIKNFPNSKLEASGEFVGLPPKQIGNSEVGHMNLGCGRVVMQTLPKINLAFKNNLVENNKDFKLFLKKHEKNKVIHLVSLYSNGGVHSHKDHLHEIIKILRKHDVKVAIHMISDGRDVSPYEMGEICKNFSDIEDKNIKICTILGRYFAMDRDNRWTRTKISYDLIVNGKAKYKFNDMKSAVLSAYKRKETDEFISSSKIFNYDGIGKGDSLLITNFRSDRILQLAESLIDPSFKFFERKNVSKLFLNTLGLIEYSDKLNKLMKVVIKRDKYEKTLGELISNEGLNQLRLAETEKFPHVTFFFNGCSEIVHKNEDRILIPSPKVKTYDLKPQMSAKLIEKTLLKSINKQFYDFIIVNLANPDMVGHTGNLKAVIKGVEVVDKVVGKIKETLDKTNGVILLTADHGNCEVMWDKLKNTPHTSHTTNKVPLILINSKRNKNFEKLSISDGKLADIAPTILELLDIKIPKQMNGESLLIKF